jgi:hypothetical protein
MKALPLRFFLPLLAALGSDLASAQQIWRCGADGRVFSDKACQQGEVVPFVAGPSRADMAAARDVAMRDQALADRLKEERVARARLAQGTGFISIGPLQADIDAKRAARNREQLRNEKRSEQHRKKGQERKSEQRSEQPKRRDELNRQSARQPLPQQPPIEHRLGQYP